MISPCLFLWVHHAKGLGEWVGWRWEMTERSHPSRRGGRDRSILRASGGAGVRDDQSSLASLGNVTTRRRPIYTLSLVLTFEWISFYSKSKLCVFFSFFLQLSRLALSFSFLLTNSSCSSSSEKDKRTDDETKLFVRLKWIPDDFRFPYSLVVADWMREQRQILNFLNPVLLQVLLQRSWCWEEGGC